jgi:hypothetical protein
LCVRVSRVDTAGEQRRDDKSLSESLHVFPSVKRRMLLSEREFVPRRADVAQSPCLSLYRFGYTRRRKLSVCHRLEKY